MANLFPILKKKMFLFVLFFFFGGGGDGGSKDIKLFLSFSTEHGHAIHPAQKLLNANMFLVFKHLSMG